MPAPPFTLNLVPYVPGSLTEPGECQVDLENHRVILAQDDIPPDGATLEITTLEEYIRAQATDTATATMIADAEQNSSDGIIEILIVDKSIDNRGVAVNVAVSELKIKSIPNISVQFETKQDGFDIGQVFRLIDSNANPAIDELLIIQTMTQKHIETVNGVDKFQYSIQASQFVVDDDYMLSKLVQTLLIPRKAKQAKIETSL